MNRKIFLAFFAVVAMALPSSNCFAAIYNLTFEQGSNGRFSYSWLHNADGTGESANRNGDKVAIGNLGNQIIGDFDEVSEIFTVTQTTTVIHDALTLHNGNVVAAGSLNITGGKLIFNDQFSGGFLDYSATIDGNSETGSFYFANRSETGSGTPDGRNPNSGSYDNVLNTIEFAEWGNNWTYTSSQVDWSFLVGLGATNVDSDGLDMANAYGNRMGLDLRGSGTPQQRPPGVPEPFSFAIWGGLALFMTVSGCRRVRQ